MDKELNYGFQIATYENTVYCDIYSSDHPNVKQETKTYNFLLLNNIFLKLITKN